jgi:tetratricopeptide (TPR) repeat protein
VQPPLSNKTFLQLKKIDRTLSRMGSAPTRPSRAVADLLRSRRRALGLTLEQVSKRLVEVGHPVPVSSLSLIETGRSDPGVFRLHRLLQLYEVPAHLVANLIEMEELSGAVPQSRDPEVLRRDGLDHWKKGEIGRALAHLMALREIAPTDEAQRWKKQQALLDFSMAAAGLGRLQLAREIMNEILCEPPDSRLVTRVLIQAATLWSRSGAPDAAMAFLKEAEARAERSDVATMAWLHHAYARALVDRGRLSDAGKRLQKAITGYRRARDSYGEARARLLKVRIAEARRDTGTALRLAEEARQFAVRHDHRALAGMALVRRGHLFVQTGKHAPAIRALQTALADFTRLGDPHGRFLAHYWLSVAYSRAGDVDRALFETRSARHYSAFVDSRSCPEARDMRTANFGEAQ